MNKIRININTKGDQEFDQGRSHLKLKRELEFFVGIKEFTEDYTALLDLKGSEKIERKDFLEDKYAEKNIGWIYMLVNGRLEEKDYSVYTQKDKNDVNRKIKFSDIFVGGGMLWLQPYLKNGEKPMGQRPFGCFISATAAPRVVKTIWTDRQNKELPEAVQFGSQVRLHIYTEAMYGQEVVIGLVDQDIFNPNDKLSITQNNPDFSITDPKILSTAFRREISNRRQLPFEEKFDDIIKGRIKVNDVEETHVQKTSIDVFMDHYWAIIAGKDLKIYPTIKTESNGKYIDFSRTYIRVKETAEKITDPYRHGNVSVQVGSIETNIKAFSPCRYTEITAGFKDETPNTLFSEVAQVNTNVDFINTGVVTNAENTRIFELKVANADTEGCSEDGEIHVDNVIDSSMLFELILDPKPDHVEGSDPEVSFVPQYPYKHTKESKVDFLNFFFDYFPVAFGNTGVKLELPINTCAYSRKVNFLIYPDALFSAHFQIGEGSNRPVSYYKEMPITLVRGLEDEFDAITKFQDFLGEYLDFIPGKRLIDFIGHLIIDYLASEAKSFAVGLHAYHTFKRTIGEDMKAGSDYRLIDYSAAYPLIPKVIIAYGVLCSVVLDAALMFFTCGGYAAVKGTTKAVSVTAKIWKNAKKARRRYKQYSAFKDLATGNFNTKTEPNYSEFSFVAPSIINSKGLGFVQDKNGSIDLELTEKMAASPLFALKYTVKGGWPEFIAGITGITTLFDGLEVANNIVGQILRAKSLKDDVDKANGKTNTASNSKKVATATAKNTKFRGDVLDAVEDRILLELEEFAEKYGQTGSIEMFFDGHIDAHYELRMNNSRGLNLSFYDKEGRSKGESKNSTGVTFGCDYGIVIGVKLELGSEFTVKWSKLEEYYPWFLPEINLKDTKTSFELEGEIGGSIHYEKKYIRQKAGPLIKQQLIVCTGLRGIIYVDIKVQDIEKNGEEDVSWGYTKGTIPDENDNTPITEKPEGTYTELLKGFVIPFSSEPVFDDSLKKYFD